MCWKSSGARIISVIGVSIIICDLRRYDEEPSLLCDPIGRLFFHYTSISGHPELSCDSLRSHFKTKQCCNITLYCSTLYCKQM